MFKLMKEPIVKSWPAVIDVPADGGQVIETKITLDFRLPGVEEHDALAALDNMPKLLRKVIKGWGNIGGPDGEALPYSEENLDALLAQPFFCVGAHQAFKEAYSGAAVKNSMRREVTGVMALAETQKNSPKK